MSEIDLNLLSALDTLLAERSVTRAAKILGLSASAMSRTLTRLRSTTADPLLVRAGRDMVLTPHGEALRMRTRAAVLEAQALLSPAPHSVDLAVVQRTFRIRANEAFVEVFGGALIAAVGAHAPFMRLHFSGKPDRKSAYLRDGDADLEIGVVGEMGPEVRVRALFRDRYVGVVRTGPGRTVAGLLHVGARPAGGSAGCGDRLRVRAPRTGGRLFDFIDVAPAVRGGSCAPLAT